MDVRMADFGLVASGTDSQVRTEWIDGRRTAPLTGTREAPSREPVWTVLLPFFNEREHLPATLAALAAQTRPFRLVLVDNGSTDGGLRGTEAGIAARFPGAALLSETRPGKTHALATGLNHVRTPYLATCDADTWYPPDYLEQAQRLLEEGGPGVHGAAAYFVEDRSSRANRLWNAAHWLGAAALLPRQTHTGGAGQIFRTESLRLVGGFDPARWPYVLEDHEIGQRLLKLGQIRYGARLWCAPSARPRDRGAVSWTLGERLLYHVTPERAKDWYFYRFLGPRLARRGLLSHRLRERSHQKEAALAPA